MGDENELTPEKHQDQIQAYAAVQDDFQTYARVLKRILEDACHVSFPEALVQSRAKTLSSFAEKVARKFKKYKNAVKDMTDLCGGRVIVQTTEQVLAVRKFIEANFNIVEADDKTELLSESTFGYRDMHYIVQLKPERDEMLKVTPDEREKIGDRKAEIQVRTWVQHAWADTLHDRIYKNALTVSSDILRTGALLSAFLEESDRTFKEMADDLDGLIANYTAYAEKTDVEKEIRVQQLVLDNEPSEKNKPVLAMKLAKLALACGEDDLVIKTLGPYSDLRDANRFELLSDLGYAICRLHRAEPSSPSYTQGRNFLEESLRMCNCQEVSFVPHLRKRESLHARALHRLGWALEVIPGMDYEARELFHQAHEHEPANPYYLANMLGFELYSSRQSDLPAGMRTTIREAVRTCHDHAVARIELPWAFFTAGRLSVLLGDSYGAIGYYARGIRHYLAGTHCVPADVLDSEKQWLMRLHFGVRTPPETQGVIHLLDLGVRARTIEHAASGDSSQTAPLLIIAGGARSIDAEALKRIRPLLRASLEDFSGTVIAGGTTEGVPGCVGDVAGELAAENRKRFRLVGYGSSRLPQGISDHSEYDEIVHVGDDFLPEQILRNWSDILEGDTRPSDVLLLGFGGGLLSAVEYRIALGLGASVGIVMHTGGTAQQLLDDDLWSDQKKLHALPMDPSTVRAFLIPPQREFDEKVERAMAKSFHKIYVSGSKKRLPPSMRPWEILDETFKMANREQAKYSVAILEAAGFQVRAPEGEVRIFDGFTDEEVERMAEMEHGRWNVERLRNGWRYGKPRDNAKQIHDCLVSWDDLDDEVKPHDRAAVRAFPKILAQAGLEVVRKETGKKG